MYTTIEPRLIALLTEETTQFASPSLELPPLQDPNILKASGRPLLLEPDTTTRNGKPTSSSQRAPTLTSLINEADRTRDEIVKEPERHNPSERALGISSPQSLRKILSDDINITLRTVSKKRLLVESSKDDFVQLPQPPKKQKAAKQVVPPIIIGLFEPPPQATLFPPIASSSFHDSHGRNTLNTVPVGVKSVEEIPKSIPAPDLEENHVSPKGNKKKKEVRTRKRWTEEETNNLLLGVKKHGLGCWTDILEDGAFKFDHRSAADLKDRFRTCCPKEWQGDNATRRGHEDLSKRVTPVRSRSSLMSENILINDEDLQNAQTANESSNSKPKKSRTHRMKLEDLVQLGIEGPFRKSNRRERRAFTSEEDREIWEGYEAHGPAWTKIQRDPQFHLQSRKPTDLRDRFRNKYPEKFRSEDKGEAVSQPKPSTEANSVPTDQQVQGNETKGNSDPKLASGASLMSMSALVEKQPIEKVDESLGKENMAGPTTYTSNAPSSCRETLRIHEIISSENDISKVLHPQTSLFGFKENFTPFAEVPNIEPTDPLPYTQSLDWSTSMTAPFTTNLGEMDISRLLLDETADWIDNPNSSAKEKQNMLDLSNIISSNDEPTGPSFVDLLCDAEQIDLHETTF